MQHVVLAVYLHNNYMIAQVDVYLKIDISMFLNPTCQGYLKHKHAV